jgi:hypothetical protein
MCSKFRLCHTLSIFWEKRYIYVITLCTWGMTASIVHCRHFLERGMNNRGRPNWELHLFVKLELVHNPTCKTCLNKMKQSHMAHVTETFTNSMSHRLEHYFTQPGNYSDVPLVKHYTSFKCGYVQGLTAMGYATDWRGSRCKGQRRETAHHLCTWGVKYIIPGNAK